MPAPATCVWCGAEVDSGDGYRVHGPEGAAVFCRLEHVVPWVMRGGAWDEGSVDEGVAALAECSECGAALGSEQVALVRHRGELRVADAFCSMEHLRSWAAAGGPYRR